MKNYVAFFIILGVTGCGAGPAATDAPSGSSSSPSTSATNTGSPAAQATSAHRRCGWIAPGDTEGVASFVAHADWYEAIHPGWFALGNDSIAARALVGADDAAVTSAARQHHVKVIPLISAVEDPSILRGLIADPAKRAAHIEALLSIARARGYDGYDLDYEKLWSAADRPGYIALVEEAAQRFHAAGMELSLAIPSIPTRNSDSAYDLEVLVAYADHVHLMGYDFHTVGTHSGPVAPRGWIAAVLARAEATGAPEKIILGVPNYGVTTGSFFGLGDAANACAGNLSVVDDHMATCEFGQYDAGRAPHCTTPSGLLYFEDIPSLEEKVTSAADHHIAGIGYWSVGREPAGFFEMIKRHF